MQNQPMKRTREIIKGLFEADLDSLRSTVNKLTTELEKRDNSGWIGSASKRQLWAEATYLLANNSEGTK